jgi:hypothetical protein
LNQNIDCKDLQDHFEISGFEKNAFLESPQPGDLNPKAAVLGGKCTKRGSNAGTKNQLLTSNSIEKLSRNEGATAGLPTEWRRATARGGRQGNAFPLARNSAVPFEITRGRRYARRQRAINRNPSTPGYASPKVGHLGGQ